MLTGSKAHYRPKKEHAYSVPSQKMLNKCSVPYIALEKYLTPVAIALSLQNLNQTRKQEWSIAIISGLVLSNTFSAASIELKND